MKTRTEAIRAISAAAQQVRANVTDPTERYLMDCLAWAIRNMEDRGGDYAGGFLKGLLEMWARFTPTRTPVLESAYFMAAELSRYGPEEIDPKIVADVQDVCADLLVTFPKAA